MPECGTPAGWRAHQKKGEPTDAACRAAWRRYILEYKRRRREERHA